MQVGSGIVLGISLLCVLTTHAGALGYGTISGGWWWFFLVAIYLEAFLAVCCLLGILYGDPGVVKRTPENCLPLPEKVAKRLQRGESLEGLENLQHAQLGSYCVRCCVWRRAPGKLQSSYLPADCDMGVCEQGSHHCSTCGRCVNHFDQCALPRRRCPIAFCPIAFCPIAIAPSPRFSPFPRSQRARTCAVRHAATAGSSDAASLGRAAAATSTTSTR